MFEISKPAKIAAFIAARLQYSNPDCNGSGNPWVSTINVDQHKDKFGHVRIYCTLADMMFVKKKWDWLRANLGILRVPRKHLAHFDVTGDEPSPEFIAACIKHDAIHYRRCYRDMVILVPSIEAKICVYADYRELTFDSVENAKLHIAEYGPEHYVEKYALIDVAALHGFIESVYEPRWSDMMETID